MLRASRLPVPAGISAERDTGAGQTGADHPDGAVAAGPDAPGRPPRRRPVRSSPGPGSSVVVSSQSGRLPAPGLQLVLDVPPEGDPVRHLGRVVDHRAAPSAGSRRGTCRVWTSRTHSVTISRRHRHRDPGRDQRRDVATNAAEERAADDVGEVVRAEQPAVERDGEHQHARRRPARRACGGGSAGSPRTRRRRAMQHATTRDHVPGGVGVPLRASSRPARSPVAAGRR